MSRGTARSSSSCGRRRRRTAGADHGGGEHRLRRAGGADHDVRPDQVVLAGRKGGDPAAEQIGHDARVRLGAVGHPPAGDAGALEVLGGETGRLPRAHQQDVAAGERAEDPLRHLHRGAGDGDRALADAGAVTHFLARLDGAQQRLVQHAVGGAEVAGRLVGRLELAEDLHLAEHLAVEPGREADQVAHRFLVAQDVGGLRRGGRHARDAAEQRPQLARARGGSAARRTARCGCRCSGRRRPRCSPARPVPAAPRRAGRPRSPPARGPRGTTCGGSGR